LLSGIQTSIAITHIDGLVLARSAFSHAMNYREKDLGATSVLRISLHEAATKVSNTNPDDKEEDMNLAVWGLCTSCV
jgi:hypothetical protein